MWVRHNLNILINLDTVSVISKYDVEGTQKEYYIMFDFEAPGEKTIFKFEGEQTRQHAYNEIIEALSRVEDKRNLIDI